MRYSHLDVGERCKIDTQGTLGNRPTPDHGVLRRSLTNQSRDSSRIWAPEVGIRWSQARRVDLPLWEPRRALLCPLPPSRPGARRHDRVHVARLAWDEAWSGRSNAAAVVRSHSWLPRRIECEHTTTPSPAVLSHFIWLVSRARPAGRSCSADG